MPLRPIPISLLLLAAFLPAKASPARVVGAIACPLDAGWNDPSAPAHVHGNTCYVGTCGISAILVTSSGGHALIDSATESAGPLIGANIRSLGFKGEDVRYLLKSHEHLDRAGGMERLQRDTGAQLVALPAAASALEHGHGDCSDPQFLSAGKFPGTAPARPIGDGDGDTIKIGSIFLVAHATPGITPGSTSWTWKSCADGRCLDIVYAGSPNPLSDDVYRFSDEGAHPGVLDAFRHSIDLVAGRPRDILLTPHPGASRLLARLAEPTGGPLIDADARRRYASEARAKLAARLARQRRADTP